MIAPWRHRSARALVALAAILPTTAFAGGARDAGPPPSVRGANPDPGSVRTPAEPEAGPPRPTAGREPRAPAAEPRSALQHRPAPPFEPISAPPRAATPEPCLRDGETLCLQGGRFRVRARFRRPSGELSAAHARTLTDDSGTFWFFDPDNIELLVKVLDGCAINRKYWVFAAGLTDREVGIEVTDTARDLVSGYRNPAGRAFRPIQDLFAFGTCP